MRGAPTTTTMTESDGPVLQSVSPVTPATVDVISAAGSFTVDVHVTDGEGLLGGFLEFNPVHNISSSPCRVTVCSGGRIDSSSRLSGSGLDGAYRVQMPMFQFAKAGTWCLTAVELSDVAGNSRDYRGSSLDPFETCFDVVSDEDLDGPALQSISRPTPGTVDVSSETASFTVDLHLTDSPAGLAGGNVEFFSPPSGDSIQTTNGDTTHRRPCRDHATTMSTECGCRSLSPPGLGGGAWPASTWAMSRGTSLTTVVRRSSRSTRASRLSPISSGRRSTLRIQRSSRRRALPRPPWTAPASCRQRAAASGRWRGPAALVSVGIVVLIAKRRLATRVGDLSSPFLTGL